MYTVPLILHHPQCSFSDWPHRVHLGPTATTFTIIQETFIHDIYLHLCICKYVMYCTCMRCAATKRGRGLSIRCIRLQFLLADSIVNPSSVCEPNWTGATEDASLKNMNWQVLLMCFSYFPHEHGRVLYGHRSRSLHIHRL